MNLGMCTAQVNWNVVHVFTNLPPHFPRKTKHSVWARIRRVSDPVIISSSYDISPIIHYLLFQPVDHWENKIGIELTLASVTGNFRIPGRP